MWRVGCCQTLPPSHPGYAGCKHAVESIKGYRKLEDHILGNCISQRSFRCLDLAIPGLK